MLEFIINSRQIFFTSSVLNIFNKFRQFNGNHNERGGILLGQVDEIANKVLVCRASLPSPEDKSNFTSFTRNRHFAQGIIDYEFNNSGGKNTYLGEWHTHPARSAIPSGQDLQMISEQFSKNELKIEFLLFCIVAQEQLFLDLYEGGVNYSVTTSF